jgi:hypothetical protein
MGCGIVAPARRRQGRPDVWPGRVCVTPDGSQAPQKQMRPTVRRVGRYRGHSKDKAASSRRTPQKATAETGKNAPDRKASRPCLRQAGPPLRLAGRPLSATAESLRRGPFDCAQDSDPCRVRATAETKAKRRQAAALHKRQMQNRRPESRFGTHKPRRTPQEARGQQERMRRTGSRRPRRAHSHARYPLNFFVISELRREFAGVSPTPRRKRSVFPS